jgi:hypothetical protein
MTITDTRQLRRLQSELALAELEVGAAYLAETARDVAPRAPLPHEVTARVDFAAIAHDLDAVTARIAGISLATRQTVLGRLQQMVSAAASPAQALAVLNRLDLTGLAGITGVQQLIATTTRAIQADLADLAQRSATRVHVEAISQGVPVDRIDTSARASNASQAQIAANAERVATATATQLVDAARQTAATVAAPGRTVADIAAAIGQTAGELSDRGVTDVAHQAANRANGLGRVDGAGGITSGGDVPVTIYASELIDTRTCYRCDLVDGTQYASESEALGDYPNGQYDGCQGGPRCRGMLVYVWGSESPATVGMS